MKPEEMSKEQLIEALHVLLAKEQHRQVVWEDVLRTLHLHAAELTAQNHKLREGFSELEDSRRHFQDHYDFAPVAYFALDGQGCVREANLTGAALLGRRRDSVIGLPLISLVKLQDPSALWKHLRRCSETQQAVESEMVFSFGGPKGGRSLRTMLATSVPVLSLASSPTLFRTTFTDITERINIQKDLERVREQDRRQRAGFEILDQSTVAFGEALLQCSTADPTKLFQVTVEYAAKLADAEFVALGLVGQPGEPFAHWVFSGVDPTSAVGPHPRPVGVLGEVVRLGTSLRLRDLNEHPSFKGFPASHPKMKSFLGIPIMLNGKAIGQLYLTNKRSAPEFSEEDQRFIEMLASRAARVIERAQLSEELRASVRARDNILALVSHDLRNALSSIGLRVNLLLRNRLTKGAHSDHLGLIQKSVEQMSQLIEDLLHAATIEAGTFTVIPKREETLPVVEEALLVMEPLAQTKAIRLQLDVPPKLPPIHGDRRRVVQVLTNLLSNAVKFVPAQGAGVIKLRVWVEKTEVHFAVSDNGPGIAQEQLSHLFERYWKGAAEQRSGIGLGLFISKGIVEAHGGQIGVKSTLYVGTTFFFSLPISQAPADEAFLSASLPPADLAKLHGLRVLIVDDEPNAVSAMAELLANEGIVPFEATSVEEAQRILKENHPDMALLDVEMPGMSGIALLELLRNSQPDLPALIISGLESGSAQIKQALQTSDVSYLPKPVVIDKLLSTMNQLLKTDPSSKPG